MSYSDAQDAKRCIIAMWIVRNKTGLHINWNVLKHRVKFRWSRRKIWVEWISLPRCNIWGQAILPPFSKVFLKSMGKPMPSSRLKKLSWAELEKKLIFSWRSIACLNWKVHKIKCRMSVCSSIMENIPRWNSSFLEDGLSWKWLTLGSGKILWHYQWSSIQILCLPSH